MFVKDPEIVDVTPHMVGDVREVYVRFDDGNTVIISPYCESWEQYGSPLRHRFLSVNIAHTCNNWLHGNGEFPYKNQKK